MESSTIARDDMPVTDGSRPSLEPETRTRDLHVVLAAWRAAEIRMCRPAAGAGGTEDAADEVCRLRDEYHAIYEAVRRHYLPIATG